MSDQIAVQRLGPDDGEAVQMALYLALSWNDPPGIPDRETVMAHPEVAIYHDGWGREGDVGIRAVHQERLVGVAFARVFTEEQHGHGYVDAQTPEVGIGVAREYRGQGIGRRLMEALAEAARAEGVLRLSLSVNNQNPAKRLYESLGYTVVADDRNATTMVLDL